MLFSLTYLQKGFVIFAAICAVMFGIFFIYQIGRVFYQMKIKGDAMPVMQEARRMYYHVSKKWNV